MSNRFVAGIKQTLAFLTLNTVIVIGSAANGAAGESTLVSFDGRNGIGPTASLTFDAVGNLYGTTTSGGPNGTGIVFKLTPSRGEWRGTILYGFPTANNPKRPWGPSSSVVFDSQGNLYGTTYYGGSSEGSYYCPNGCGTVYRLTPSASGQWKETTLYSFRDSKDGGMPVGGVVFDALGNLYGTTSMGGTTTSGCASGCGTIFELSPTSADSEKFILLHSFTGSVEGGDGDAPIATLAYINGNLYGTTLNGGAFNSGTIFQLTPSGAGRWNYSVIHSFPAPVLKGNDGAYVEAGVIADTIGNLYGTTAGGGYYMLGSVFMLSPGVNGWTSTLLYSFQGLADGVAPAAGVTFDSAGNLWVR